jgi:hypothetical protein
VNGEEGGLIEVREGGVGRERGMGKYLLHDMTGSSSDRMEVCAVKFSKVVDM